MRRLELGNAVFALVMELVLLASVVVVGLRLPGPLPIAVAAAVLLPALVIAVWAFALAPKAATRLPPAGRLALQAALFAAACVALAAVGLWPLAVVVAVAAAARLTLGAMIRAV